MHVSTGIREMNTRRKASHLGVGCSWAAASVPNAHRRAAVAEKIAKND